MPLWWHPDYIEKKAYRHQGGPKPFKCQGGDDAKPCKYEGAAEFDLWKHLGDSCAVDDHGLGPGVLALVKEWNMGNRSDRAWNKELAAHLGYVSS